MTRTLTALVATLTLLIASGSALARPRPGEVLALSPTPLADAAASKVQKASRGRAVFHVRDEAWKIFYALPLRAALPSPDLTLRFYDVSRPGQRRYIGSREKMAFDPRGMLTGTFTLKRAEVFSPNARVLVELLSADALVARREFYIQAPDTAATPVTTEVDFTDDVGASDDGAIDRRAFTDKPRRG